MKSENIRTGRIERFVEAQRKTGFLSPSLSSLEFPTGRISKRKNGDSYSETKYIFTSRISL